MSSSSFPPPPLSIVSSPQLGAVALEGVSGRLYNGQIATVRSTDDLLPLELSNVGWTLAPQALLRGTGATIRFDAYAVRVRDWSPGCGMAISALPTLWLMCRPSCSSHCYPYPSQPFDGQILGDIEAIRLADNLLTRFEGTLRWNNAVLQTPVATTLGNVEIQISPVDEQSHDVRINANGGDVAIEGSVNVSLNGDFSADVLFTPSPDARPMCLMAFDRWGVLMLRVRVRFVRRGNLNRLM